MTHYRFWGRTNPAGRTKPPIRAQVASLDQGDGVHRLYLYDVIDSWGGDWGVSALEFVAALAEIPDNATEIRLHINSPGGEVYEGIAINNVLRQHPARVVAVVDGLAASAASFIAAAADELVMGPDSQLMIHDAWGIAIGPAEAMEDMRTQLDRISNNIASMYQRKGGGDIADWRAAMLAETWYSDSEAVAAGLADRIDGADAAPEDAPESAVEAFDRSQYRFHSRAAAPPPAAIAPPPPGRSPAGVAAVADSERADRHARRRHEMNAARHALS